MWDKATLDANGGHSPECEGYCDPTCPIGQERMAEAWRRVRKVEMRARYRLLTPSEAVEWTEAEARALWGDR